MAIEPRYSLRRAAEALGVDRGTLKGWLAEEGIFFSGVARGSKYLIREADLERVIRKRSPSSDMPRLRLLKRSHRERTRVA